ncbi:MAG: UPF0164 family protein [Candidatus Muirbacterium halophilum]|nr:UPF0164 family protein [Candidatus Muirbacterium halophilum]
MKKLGAIFGLLALCVFSFASDGGAGQAGAYLKMGVGARALGMGGAFVAVSDDATASYWNPAGLAKLKKDQASFMHAKLKLDRNFDFINYVKKQGENQAIAFSVIRFGVDNIPETRIWRFDSSGNLKSNLTFGNPYYYIDTATGDARAIPVTTTGANSEATPPTVNPTYDNTWTKEQVEGVQAGGDSSSALQTDIVGPEPVKIFSNFDDNEDTMFVSWSKGFDNLYLGANFKYMTQSLFGYDADSFGMDIGLLYDYTSKLTFGLSIRDLFGEMKWDTPSKTADKIPVTTQLGIAYRPMSTWLIALDYNKVENMSSEFYFGAEKAINDILSVRIGSNDSDFSAGLSFYNEEWVFEYAYAEQELGNIHRFSTTRSFK